MKHICYMLMMNETYIKIMMMSYEREKSCSMLYKKQDSHPETRLASRLIRIRLIWELQSFFLSKHGKTLSIFSGSSSFNPIDLFVSSSKQVTIATYSFISNLFCNFIFVGSSKVIHRINFLSLMQGTNLVAFNR